MSYEVNDHHFFGIPISDLAERINPEATAEVNGADTLLKNVLLQFLAGENDVDEYLIHGILENYLFRNGLRYYVQIMSTEYGDVWKLGGMEPGVQYLAFDADLSQEQLAEIEHFLFKGIVQNQEPVEWYEISQLAKSGDPLARRIMMRDFPEIEEAQWGYRFGQETKRLGGMELYTPQFGG